MDPNGSDDENIDLTPPEVREKAANAEANLIPAKSHDKYMRAYKLFIDWKIEKKCNNLSENVFLAYFNEKAVMWKPSTLWAQYSMLRSTLILNNKVDIGTYSKITAFLKSKSKGFQSQKAKIFTGEQIQKFLSEAPDQEYLAAKVIAIFGVTGACRCCELPEITLKHIELKTDVYLVQIPKTKNCNPRSFAITGELAKIVKKYAEIRPTNAQTERFFLNYQRGKCTIQPIGINKFRKTPQQIAEFLKLDNPESYTGHSFRRTSATVFVDAGADMMALKRHGGWKSDTVAAKYIDDSFFTKNKAAMQIEGAIAMPSSSSIESKNPKRIRLEADNSTAPENLSNQQVSVKSSSGIHLTNCTNVVINFKK